MELDKISILQRYITPGFHAYENRGIRSRLCPILIPLEISIPIQSVIEHEEAEDESEDSNRFDDTDYDEVL